MSDERTFSRQELGELIRRATERQHATEQAADNQQLSLEDIKRIAADIGVEPSHIDAVLPELGGNELDASHSFLIGAPTTFVVRRRVRGTLDNDSQTRIVAEIRKHMKRNKGHVEIVGGTLHWRSSVNWDEASVRVEQDGEFVAITTKSTFAGPAWAFHFPIAVVALMGLLAVVIPRNVSAGYVALGISMALFVALRFALRMASRKTEASVETLTDKIARHFVEQTSVAANIEATNILSGAEGYVNDVERDSIADDPLRTRS